MTARTTRRSPRGETRRAEIIDAAMEEIAAHGYHGMSLAAVADRVGISQSGLLHHFASKEILLDAVVQKRFAEDSELVDRLGLGTASPLAGYDSLIHRNIDHQVWMQFLMVIQAEGLTDENPAFDLIRNRYQAVRERIVTRIDSHVGDEFDLPSHLDRRDIATLLLAAMDGLQLQWLYDPTIDMRRTFRMLISLIESSPDPDSYPA
ncbi:TetR/AcrR family transcriptional regulator [Microbacterium sp. NPDC056569]|uniref:TetR/AcrR family transcriptional regulator n=1 Tax=Microbacterium sp. NPDC056569 TaxID=3345867 RepID=UPI00366F1D70